MSPKSLVHLRFKLQILISVLQDCLQLIGNPPKVENPEDFCFPIKSSSDFLWYEMEYWCAEGGIPAAAQPPYILFPSTSPISY